MRAVFVHCSYSLVLSSLGARQEVSVMHDMSGRSKMTATCLSRSSSASGRLF